MRLEDLVRPTLLIEKVRRFFPLKKAIVEKAYGYPMKHNMEEIIKEYVRYGEKLAPYIGDVSSLVSRLFTKKRFLFEQAHGTMLDPVFGTYPFTVAPPTIASGVFPSIGMPAKPVRVLGVVKAYTTRVGNGPFPTELSDATGETMRIAGGEFGTVSKRPRRVGWLDIPSLRYAVRLNGCHELVITKLDVLSGFKQLNICVGYREGKNVVAEFPAESVRLASLRPVYTTMSGWAQSIRSIKKYQDLPREAKVYIHFLQKQLQIPIRCISVGPERKECIRL